MKVTGISPSIKTEKVQGKKTEDSAVSRAEADSGAADRVVLSSGSLEAQKARDILARTPEVRADRVEALKGQIERGEYTVDPHRLSDKMMASLLSDNPLN